MRLQTTLLAIFYALIISFLNIVAVQLKADESNKSPHLNFNVWSWNVWFDDASGTSRYPAIIKTLEHHQPNIIFLQEVTENFISELSKSKLTAQYHISKTSNSGYSNLTLSKFRATKHVDLKLPSFYGRHGLITTIDTTFGELQLINVHLDSGLDDTTQRLKQITLIEDNYDSSVPALFAGDFNFGNNTPEEQRMKQHWLDAAEATKEHHLVTYDVENNPLAKQTKFWFEPSRRLDRIYLNQALLKNLQLQFPAEIDRFNYQVASHINNPINSVAETSTTGGLLSDHHPVIVNIRYQIH